MFQKLNIDKINNERIKSLQVNRRLTNQDALIPIGMAGIIAGGLSLIQQFFSPTAPMGTFYWYCYLALFSALFLMGIFLLVFSKLQGIRMYLPLVASVGVSMITAWLASVDSLSSRDMSALVIGLVGGTITMRTRMLFHFLRNIATILLYIIGVLFLSSHIPGLGDLINSLVHMTIAMLVAYTLEKYSSRAFHFQQKLEERNRDLIEISFKDKLTGLYNRHFVDETLEKVVAISRRRKTAVSVMMLDIDFFKRINDDYGHEEGDRVLVSVSAALSRSIRSSDILGRIGGEEFLVILPETPIEGAQVVAENLLDAVRNLGPGAVPRPITVSAGVAQWRQEEQLKTFLRRADVLLYEAKNSGRNCFRCMND